MVFRSGDTIAAIATARGTGALSVIRVSGPHALKIVDSVFRGASPLLQSAGFTAHAGWVLRPDGSPLDQIIATVFRAPRSYTGENAVEISCHGGALVTDLVLERVLSAGARPANPGEFTRRAFLNGKMDLTQAEAVLDLIAATSDKAERVSLDQLRGKLGDEIRRIRNELVSFCSMLELNLDFSEEGIEVLTNEQMRDRIKNANESISRLIHSYRTGKLLQGGVSVAITGEPNVGKSSVFNALLRHERSIVTHIPGTTRDTIEESITIGGYLFRLTDTAGIRESEDPVETEGIDRARRAIGTADLVLLVTDVRKEPPARPEADGNVILVRNKVDLIPCSERPPENPGEILLSARTEEGLDLLRSEMLKRSAGESEEQQEGHTVTRRRHLEILARSEQLVKNAKVSAEAGLSGEFIALDMRGAADALGEITGEVTTEEILNSIFSAFCIGK